MAPYIEPDMSMDVDDELEEVFSKMGVNENSGRAGPSTSATEPAGGINFIKGENYHVECGICLDSFYDSENPPVSGFECGTIHILHLRCLHWYIENNLNPQITCPYCKAPLRKN